MSTYLLIHGAWHGSWCWRYVAPLLTAAGHQVYAPDLPGHGDPSSYTGDITFADYSTAIASLMHGCHEPVILVGHSMAGLILSQLASNFPEKIAKLIYLAAFVPNHNESLIDINQQIPAQTKAKTIELNLQFDFDNKLIHLLNQNVSEAFYADCSSEDQEYAAKSIQAQPLKPFITAIKLSEAFATVNKEYIICTNDRTLHPETQEWLATRQHCTIKKIKTGHSPFFADPAGLIKLIT